MTSRTLLLASFLHLVGCVVSSGASNDRPIIGVLTQPLNVELLTDDYGVGTHSNLSYVAASYVKFVESAGGRVVPLHFGSSDAELTTLFHQINGLILPGGGANLRNEPGNRFRAAAQLLFGLALKATDGGDPFPIHATCLGFQLLGMMVANDDGALCRHCYDTEGTPLPLEMTPESRTSRLFSALPDSLWSAVTSQNITENSHQNGLAPTTFANNDNLSKFFQVLSVNADSRGNQFVSTMEAKHYPISATQWHPEKNNFEWGKIGKLGYKAIPHSQEAVRLSQYIADNFVNRARQNTHSFASPQAETQALIENHPAAMDPQGYFSQIYLWGQAEQNHLLVV